MRDTLTQTRGLFRVAEFFIEPHASVQDIGERRRAQLLSTLSLTLAVALSWGLLSNPAGFQSFILLFAITILSYSISRTRYYRVGAYFFSYGINSLAYLSLYLGFANSFANTITTSATVALIIASILLSFRGFVILVILSTIATFGAPLYSQISPPDSAEYFRTSGVYMSIGLLLIGAYAYRAWIERERVRQVNEVNRELEQLTDQLEIRVKERTAQLDQVNLLTSRRVAQLQTIAALAQAIAHEQTPEAIFSAAAKLISDRFGFYHVGIFIIDNDREYAVLQATNSAGGQNMLKRGHRLMLGTGVVGFAAQTGKPRIALDVGADAIFFNNPDLPETRSEIALPLTPGDRTIGVLDVQSTEAGAFSEEDFQVLGTLANQLSLAIENARLLSEARTSAAQVQAVYNEFVRTEWSRTEEKTQQAGFRYNAGRIEMMGSALDDTTVLSAVETGRAVANQPDGSEEKRARAVVPVKLRGEVIGVLNIESNDPNRIWRSDEVSLMEAVAERVALAMENARLFQDARRRASKERMIAEATSLISSSLNIENILQATATELERVLGGSEVLIQFNNRNST